MKKYLLEFIVFVCGAVCMILELAGSRIMAPYFGNSLLIWTSLIGIILGSLSLGYWLGGRLADRQADYKTLSLIIFIAALAIFLIAPTKTVLIEFLVRFNNLPVGSLLSSLILFAPASIFLGMVSPYAAKLKLKDLSTTGATVGSLYAISTIGSIVGTFSAGFYFIPTFGNSKIIIILALVLLLISIISAGRFTLAIKPIIFLLLVPFLFINNASALYNYKIIADQDSYYNRLIVYDSIDQDSKRPIRNLMTDPFGIQSSMFLDKDDGLVFTYSKYFYLAEHFNPNFKKALLIGGGAYSWAKEFLKKYPQANLDVAEIDSEYTNLARKYFNLKDNPRMEIHEQDGRTFINQTSKKYDVIYLDAFNSALSIPFYLTTAETVQQLSKLLNANGIILINLISAIDGDKGKFLRAEYQTYKKYFSFVYVFPTYKPNRGDIAQNLIMVAVKSAAEPSLTSLNPQFDQFLNTRWQKNILADVPILTDDFCPVDQYMLAVLK